jgi:hypothetical protein
MMSIFFSVFLGILFAGIWLQIGNVYSQNEKINDSKEKFTTKSLALSDKNNTLDQSIKILIDDFSPQPYQGDSIYYYNRLGGDRGAIGNASLDWGLGQVTATINTPYSWGGGWTSLNHLQRENIPINLSAVLPSEISSPYQSRVTDLQVKILEGTPGAIFNIQLKNGSSLKWIGSTEITGEAQVIAFSLPTITDTTTLLWILDTTGEEDYIVLDELSFTVTTEITNPLEAGFVWSYGMLLSNWDPVTGLVRDRSRFASGEFDAIQATGSLAAATSLANQLGFVEYNDAVEIVSRISNTLLISTPRYHGLLPHFVEIASTDSITIVNQTEWSSIDTVIAIIALLDAQNALGLDTAGSEQLLQSIDWADLLTPNGISHGYTYSGEKIAYSWDTFGGESWLVNLAYAAATQEIPAVKYPTPPTANGSGFIDELAWLFVLPPSRNDYWGVNWKEYREYISSEQLQYYINYYPTSCLSQLSLFGLSASEVPIPSAVSAENIYQAFGIGGRFSPAYDGVSLLGDPVVVPHYSSLIASNNSQIVTDFWFWLIDQGLHSPLNNVESLMFITNLECSVEGVEWNHLKGSWNLSLQTLGLGRYLVEQQNLVPNIWWATISNKFLRRGYDLLAPDTISETFLPVTLK